MKHWVEIRSISQAQGALHELARLLPDTATRIVGERTEDVSVAELRVGDVVLVGPARTFRQTAPSAMAPATSTMITDESRPVARAEMPM